MKTCIKREHKRFVENIAPFSLRQFVRHIAAMYPTSLTGHAARLWAQRKGGAWVARVEAEAAENIASLRRVEVRLFGDDATQVAST